ncbi:MAG: PIN domain-containing protein [Candidatus Brocadiae bacterium]|nr:PIN domain-containing protein [Candidatus Brocadiia bacterium]
MEKVLLDTDIFSEITKRKNPKVEARAIEYRKIWKHYTISVLTVLEQVKGFQKIKRFDALQDFLLKLPKIEVLLLDIDASKIAGSIYGDLERTGQTIGRCDPMIAGIAIANNLILATGNTEHYGRIKGLGYPLILENWKE